MIVRELITLLGFQVDKRGEDKANKTFTGLKAAAGALAAIFVTGAIGRGLREMVELAGAAEETASQLDATFGNLAEGVRDFAETTAEDMGRSRFEIERFAASTGAIVKPILGSATAAAEMSKQVAGLSVDLASFFDAADTDALVALQAGLVGQSEPLRRFGVVLLQSSLAAFAQEEGITKSLKAMTEGEKVALRFRFIMSQTADAQGDAARTAGSYTNMSRRLGAVLDELKIEIGKELLPAATAFLRFLVETVRVIKGPVVTTVRLLIRTMGALLKPIPLIVAGLLGLRLAFVLVGRQAILAWLATAAPALLTIAVLGLVSAAILVIIDDLETMGEGGESVIGTLITGFQDLLEETGSLAESIREVLVTAWEFWAEKLGVTREEMAIVTKEFEKWIGLYGKLASAITSVPTLAVGAATGLGGIAGGISAIRGATGGASTNVGGATVNINVSGQTGEEPLQFARRIGQIAGPGVEAVTRRIAQQLAVGGGG